MDICLPKKILSNVKKKRVENPLIKILYPEFAMKC